MTRAYGNTAGLAIETADLIEYVVLDRLLFTLDYAQMQEFEYYLKKHSGVIIEQQFEQQIELIIEIPRLETQNVLQRFNGQLLA